MRTRTLGLTYACATLVLLCAAPAAAQDSDLRVFFMGRSEYGSSGGIPAPFEEVCALAGTSCSGHRHWDFVEPDRANGLPIGLAAMAQNRHVRNILQTEAFDGVFFSFFAYNSEFHSPEPEYTAEVLAGAESLYRQFAAAGAQPLVYLGYATLDNPGDTARIAEGAALLKARLDSIARAESITPAVFVPAGQFASAMSREFGVERWFADPLHPSELGQYAIARLIFTCIAGRDPASYGHPERIPEADGRKIDVAIHRVRNICQDSERAPGSRTAQLGTDEVCYRFDAPHLKWKYSPAQRGGAIVSDSTAIVRMLAARHPGPVLGEAEGARRLLPATMQPMRPTVGRWLDNSYWRRLAGDSIEVIWREGFYGPVFRLEVDGDTLRGIARQTTDAIAVGRPRPQPQPVTAVRVECPMQPTQTGFLDRYIRRGSADHPYQVHVPRDYDPNVEWPVILFLHGAGERGTDGVRQTAVGLGPALRLDPERWPAIVVFPQAPPDSAWSGVPAAVAVAALERTLAEFSTDRDRVYLTGNSMGGNGVWHLAYHYAHVFAAIAPVCAWVSGHERFPTASNAVPAEDGDPFAALAEQLADMPTWIFHGDADPAVPVEESRRAAAALRARNPDVRYTELPGTGHNAWDPAYGSAEFAAWLLAQRRQ